METPFVFGKIAAGENFTNREAETKQIVSNLISGINTVLISPRRWGKSSLVLKAARAALKKEKKLRICFIDLFNIRSEEEFYHLLAQEVIKATASKWEERIRITKKFISHFIPKVTYGIDDRNEFSLGLDWKEVKKRPDEILDMAEKIAAENKYKIVICIDEFQHIASFENPLAFQKKLRAHWQQHQNVSYCLYGSKRHMMLDVFTSSSMPFYKFGELLFLQKIDMEDWVPFIVSRFSETKKKISPVHAGEIAQLVERHPYYVQQLAQQVWLRTTKKSDKAIITDAFESLLMQLSFLFQNLTDNLNSKQINFLHALIDEVRQFSSQEVLSQYKMGTSANVIRIKQALISREIIDVESGKINFLDPLYKSWLKKYYFDA